MNPNRGWSCIRTWRVLLIPTLAISPLGLVALKGQGEPGWAQRSSGTSQTPTARFLPPGNLEPAPNSPAQRSHSGLLAEDSAGMVFLLDEVVVRKMVSAIPETSVPTWSLMGAFPLLAGPKDAVLTTTLAPGGYTVQVGGIGGSSGQVLLEVYAVP